MVLNFLFGSRNKSIGRKFEVQRRICIQKTSKINWNQWQNLSQKNILGKIIPIQKMFRAGRKIRVKIILGQINSLEILQKPSRTLQTPSRHILDTFQTYPILPLDTPDSEKSKAMWYVKCDTIILFHFIYFDTIILFHFILFHVYFNYCWWGDFLLYIHCRYL